MGATMRITWLLLSLHFILHGATQNVTVGTTAPAAQTATVSPTIKATEASLLPTPDNKPVTNVTPATNGTQTGDDAQDPNKDRNTTVTDAPAQTQQPTDKPAVPTTITNNVPPSVTKAAAIPTLAGGGGGAAAAAGTTAGTGGGGGGAAATVNPAIVVAQTSTAGSSGGVVLSSATQAQTTDPSTNNKTPAGTGPTVTQPGGSNKEGTTKATDIKIITTGQGQSQGIAPTTAASHTDNGGQSTVKVTQEATTKEQTQTKPTETSGVLGTTGQLPTVTKATISSTVDSKASDGVTTPQTNSRAPGATAAPTPAAATITVPPLKKNFSYSMNTGQESQDKKEMVEVCKRLMVNMQNGTCTLMWTHGDKINFDRVEISGEVKPNVASEYLEEITKKPTDNKILIAILASCGALLIMIVILAVCASHHRRPYNENQQHLTEELHTVENGYHDNPTLEVMEVQPEMQEKKMALNGEFNDSWIVPIDNLLKEDMPDEEDTHL